mgnify:CR=1 FL=1
MKLVTQLRPRRRAVSKHVAILGLGTATPPMIPQEQTTSLALEIAGTTADRRAWMQRVFLRTGIERRGSVLQDADNPLEDPLRQFYPVPTGPDDRGPSTGTRMQRYAAVAPALAHRAAAAAMSDAGVEVEAVTHLITVSCTGFVAPGLDASLIGSLGLSPTVRRLHVGFMGCSAALNALGAAGDAVRADPRATVLVCCVELCSLHYAYGWDPGRMVANALFADGAAAAVLGATGSGGGRGLSLRDTGSFLFPDSLDAMGWTIGDHGFEMTLSPGIPDCIRGHLRGWCEQWLGRHGLRIGDVASWIIHPGGPKVLDAVADALGLEEAALRNSRKVLAGYGNMSSATVLFVLKELVKEGRQAGPCVGIALGPGLVAEGVLLE